MRALLLVLMLSACIHRVGDACVTEEAHCADPHSKLACGAAGLMAIPCPGAGGCSLDGQRTVLCDQSSGAQPGQLCFPEYEGTGQCAGPAMLQCLHGAWTQLACNPGHTCVLEAGGVTCR
jgi:hypothetical protein